MKVTIEELKSFAGKATELIDRPLRPKDRWITIKEFSAATPLSKLQRGCRYCFFSYNNEILAWDIAIGISNRQLLNTIGSEILMEEQYKKLIRKNKLNDDNIYEWIRDNCKRIELITTRRDYNACKFIAAGIIEKFVD